MPINSQKFNELIGRRYILQEMLKTNILEDCPCCKTKVQLQLDNIQSCLENNCEMGVVSHG